MSYNVKLAARVREKLLKLLPPDEVAEKTMFGGICFMVRDKMCVCVRNDELMCRVGPVAYEAAIERNGVRAMIHGGKIMPGFVY